ncbi:MAG: caspase family protein, partial [candidate division NC10 bacterium]
MPLTLREGQNTLVLTATDAAGAMQQEARTVHYERGVPLAVEVRFPAAGARMEHETTVVVANAASSRGVARVTVSVNGVEAHQQVERSPRKAVAVTAPVVLREGANAIVIRATEPDGTERQEVRTVIYDKPKTAVSASPPAQTRPAPNRWAVVIGVGQYESEGITRLRYTVPDAEAVYQMLVGPGGLKKEHALLLTDKTERKPTLRNIRWALGTFLSRAARKDDTVLIFFAGHGAPEIDPQGVERDGLAKYLIPSDADPDDLYSTALPMDDIQTIFGRIEAERVIVFLDACYSGAAGGRTFSSKKTRGSHVDDLFLERLTRSKGRAIITASRPAEVSIELPELGHGLFTYYLLQGLRGAADLNRDGIVSLQELYEYVEQQVSQKSRAVGG